MLNITRDLNERQGLDTDKWYEAKVVANNDQKHPDGMMLGRIQARVDVLFDGIKDSALPWAVPFWAHPDGASPLSGVFSVPKVGTKVMLRFQEGSAAFPVYHGYHVDMKTQIAEVRHNYPDRAVVRFSNKALLIVDTKDNNLYLRNPGNVKIFIDGNVEMEVNGNVDELIRGNVTRRIQGNLDEIVNGSRNYSTSSNYTDNVSGDRTVFTQGNSTASASGSSRSYTQGTVQFESSSAVTFEGSMVYTNSGRSQGAVSAPSAPKTPTISDWPGVPGGSKGTNTRNVCTKSSLGQPAPDYAADTDPPTLTPLNP